MLLFNQFFGIHSWMDEKMKVSAVINKSIKGLGIIAILVFIIITIKFK